MYKETAKDAPSEASIASQPQTFAVIIANPASGSYALHAGRIEKTMAFLRKAGWRVDLRLTKEAGDAHRLTGEAVAEHANVVIAAGGDGTINGVIQELAGSETALGVLPIGTVNVWAREMGIPFSDEGAQDVLLNGKTRRIDLGRVNDRYFLLMVGIGFDGEVTHTVERKPLKRLGVVGYLLASFWLGFGYKSFQVYLKIGDRAVKTRAMQIVIGNTQLYGGAVKITWQAKCDDGLLDVCLVRKRNRFELSLVIIDFLLRRERRRQWVSYETCENIEVHTRKPVAIQIDGEPVGYTPATFTAVPNALKVIVPQQAPESLFTQK